MPTISNPVDLLSERCFVLANEAATEAFGQRLAHAFSAVYTASANGVDLPSVQIHLNGSLGSGKTALTRATLRALGHTGRVPSPTYTLVESYPLVINDKPLTVYHFDLYRFTDPEEWDAAGFRDYFKTRTLCLIEWPQQAGKLLGLPDLTFTLEVISEGRRLVAQAFSEIGKKCLDQC